MLIQLQQKTFDHPTTVGENRPMNDASQWLKAIQSGFEKHKTIFMAKSYEEQEATHAGLIYYMHLCWAKEKGACLRPDMIWYCIVSEIAQKVLNNPEDFRYLFTDSAEKKDIVQLTGNLDPSYISIDQLTSQIHEIIQNQEFMNLICQTTFPSAPETAKYALQMSFACMGTPFFNYMTTKCGIPALDLQGSLEEWSTLYRATLELLRYPPQVKESYSQYKVDSYKKWVSKCLHTLNELIFHAFGKIMDPNFKILTQNSQSFFNDIFHYGPETQCGSGHDDINLAYGWIRNFYMSGYDQDLMKFPAHISYVPYINIETGRTFFQACGLVYSKEKDGILYPDYGLVKHEILDEKLYRKMAKLEKEDEYTRMMKNMQ